MKKHSAGKLALLTSLLLCACGGGGGSSSAPPAAGDTVAPVVVAPPALTIAVPLTSTGLPASDSRITAFLGAASATDNVGVIGGVSNNAPAFFPVGLSQVIFSAKDAAGNSGSAFANLTIVSQINSTNLIAGDSVNAGSQDGSAAAARFSAPFASAVDSQGNLFVSDSRNYTIRKISPAGLVTTFAGQAGASGSSDGAQSQFSMPTGIAIDKQDNLYVIDGSKLRLISPAGLVSSILVSQNTASTYQIYDISADKNGNVYLFASISNGTPSIYRVQPNGSLSLYLSLGSLAIGNFTIDANGYVILANAFSHAVYRVNMSGDAVLLAGQPGKYGNQDGIGDMALMDAPGKMVWDSNGNLLVADQTNNNIRSISPAGKVTTIAGNGGPSSATSGNWSGSLSKPTGLSYSKSGLIVLSGNAVLKMQ